MALTKQTLIQYCEYIRNTGRRTLSCAAFDDDWEPVGPAVRLELARAGYVAEIIEGEISLTQRGRELVRHEERNP